MGIAMVSLKVSLKRSKTGLWSARKSIPSDVREAFGKREEKKTWPAALSVGQAKAELAAWLEPIEGRIERLRASERGEATTLRERQAVALAGEWYKEISEAEERRFTDSGSGWD